MVDQIVLDLNERLGKLEKDLLVLSGNIEMVYKAVVNHQHLGDGTAAFIKITRLDDKEGPQ